jgi:site-specific DNA recombinase
MPTAAPIAAVYARVSTEDQGKGFSLPTQIEACQKLAAHEGYTVPETHVLIDEGISGTTMDRPGLRRLRELVNTRAIAAAIVYDPDRLSRNLGHQLLLAEEFERASVKLLIVSHPLEQGPEGWLFFQMRGALAEYERAKILERTKRGMLGRAKAGYPLGGSVPLGFRYVGEPHPGHLEIDAEEAALVRRIFEMCLSGISTWGIARRLTAERVPSRRDRQPWAKKATGRKGLKGSGAGVWHHSSVGHILRNEAYIGTLYWNKSVRRTKTTIAYRPPEEWISIPIPPIVSDAIFAAAQAQLARNKVVSARNRRREYLLVGRRLRCGRCGRTMVGFCSKGTRRYRCSSVVNVADPEQRCRGSVKADLVEGEVWAAVERVLAQPELIAVEVARQHARLEEVRAAQEQDKQPIYAALARCDRDDQHWLDAYMKEAITADELKAYRHDIQRGRTALQGQLAELDARLAGAVDAANQVAALTGYCARVRQRLQTFDVAEKRVALEALNIQSSWARGERLVIEGSIPLDGGSVAANTPRCWRRAVNWS